MKASQSLNLLRSILHNLGVAGVGFLVAYLGTRLDLLLGLHPFGGLGCTLAAWVLLVVGFLTRVWAAFEFYERHMKVIVLAPQSELVTTGPFRFSRNPLYLGGNVFTFFGATLLLGTPSGILITLGAIFFTDRMIRREERQLEREFGDEWDRYRSRVRRWL